MNQFATGTARSMHRPDLVTHRQLVITGTLLLLDGAVPIESGRMRLQPDRPIVHLCSAPVPAFYGSFSSILDHTGFLIHGLDGKNNRGPPSWQPSATRGRFERQPSKH